MIPRLHRILRVVDIALAGSHLLNVWWERLHLPDLYVWGAQVVPSKATCSQPVIYAWTALFLLHVLLLLIGQVGKPHR